MNSPTPRYAVVLTRVRPGDGPRDERRDPEPVICRCRFHEARPACFTARGWATQRAVREGKERVKIIAVDPGASRLRNVASRQRAARTPRGVNPKAFG